MRLSVQMNPEMKYRCNSGACQLESVFHELVERLNYDRSKEGVKEAYAECPRCGVGLIRVDLAVTRSN